MSHICPANCGWRCPELKKVDLKWAEGELWALCRLSQWLNAGISGATANIKTQRETYPSGVIKEGEIRWDCKCVCVVELKPPPTLPCKHTHIETVHFLSSSCQRLQMKKGALFSGKKRWQLLWSRISSLYWVALGTLTCKYLLIPALSKPEQTFHSSAEYPTHIRSDVWSTHKQHHPSIDKIRHWMLPISTYSVIFLTILTSCGGFFCCRDLDAYQNRLAYLPSESCGALWYRDK